MAIAIVIGVIAAFFVMYYSCMEARDRDQDISEQESTERGERDIPNINEDSTAMAEAPCCVSIPEPLPTYQKTTDEGFRREGLTLPPAYN